MLARVHSRLIIRSRVAQKLALSNTTSTVQNQGLLVVTRRAFGNIGDRDGDITNELLKSEIMAGE